ncbi:pentapeptide repeat protein [Scytonema sp. HK-05]|nr:pentapeptide repeat protein [Scytonema sp. HK-05]
MRKRLSHIWRGFRELFSTETLETTVESGKAVLEGAKTLQEQGKNLELLKPLVEQSSSLLEVLCSPTVQVVGAGLPFVPIAIAILRLYRHITRKEPILEECVTLLSQAAYLESFKEIISLPDNQSILAHWNSKPHTEAVRKQLQKLGDFELDAKATRRAIVSFPNSELAQEYNQVLSARLQQAGLGEDEARTFAERVAFNSEPHFIKALSQAGESVKQLAELYRNGGLEALKKYDSIDQYLEEQIAPKPDEPVFNETFSFRDIYVPLKARNVDKNGDMDDKPAPCDLETWAKNILLDQDANKKRQVIFIQGGPGRGKSVFCRMFADWVRQYLHPMWTPILIRLRDIDEFQPSLEETLRSRVKYDFAQSDDGWLTDAHKRFLFILDGFDELRIERSSNQSVERFLRQIGTFQFDYNGKHRVLITGRAMALHGIDRLPANLERVEIAEMNAKLQNQWFTNWRKHFDTDKSTAFQQFLQDNDRCPKQVQELAKEPLLLYMLAAMHRDDKLDISKFEQASGTAAKILAYEQALDWVLTKQRSDDRHPDLNYELTKQNPEALRRLLAEAAVCVVQSGGESASMQMVKARLQQDDEARQLIERAEKGLGEEALKTALSAFYLKSNSSGGVEFFHKSFGEFLCAERLKDSLVEWTEPGRRGKTFNIDDKQLYEQIYDLLGYGALTQEIVEYLMGLLIGDGQDAHPTSSNKFQPVQLFQRLEDFYQRWCDGEFIDSTEETLPQRKARELQKQGIKLGQRQVDIYAGLNVMILLLELHRYAQERDDLKDKIAFYPCGQKDSEGFDETRLLRIIGYSYCINVEKFSVTVGQFLSKANLSGANLFGSNLNSSNFSGADLSDANLFGSNLNSSNFSAANLSSANLFGSNLNSSNFSGANLSSANLFGSNLNSSNFSGANLRDADLRGADLRDVDLRGADLRGANLSNELFGDIRWDENTKWEDVKGLQTAINVPKPLRQKLGLE